ncbi:karyopherin, putative (macronuclear) [Tetrahymena thermophila SB210]|uniref:Karyopherin, putative n=1 Tax=Tetrahymena thermophila (strain SB210) TaxID=312017 RepID=I7M0A6_TETTS|nr:karyopherin, putative [Tetrahymena thermophila SB210]EAR86075.2 karyopherin, putative [Tetrahymena thermophila SB210]|eukprot:XP_976670.2 karyopherin, putative [Tetrahymena thermophila SB210]
MSGTPEITNLDQAIEVMNGILSGNNEKIKIGTKLLKHFCKKTDSISIFTYILAHCQQDNLRHLAGILLKRNMIANFSNLAEQAQKDLQMVLLERFFSESMKSVRKSIGALIGIIAKLTLPEGKWAELLQVIQQHTDKSQTLQNRIYGLQLLELVLDYSASSISSFYNNFYPFFKESIQDSNKDIRIGTLKCLVNLFDNIQDMTADQINLYKELVGPILNILDSLIDQNDEDLVYYCFDALNLLTENKKSILDQHLGQIVEYMCSNKVLGNPKLSKKIKEVVIDMIFSASQYHKSVFNKNTPLLKKVIESICLIIATPFSEEDLEDGEEPLQDIALWLVLSLSMVLNKKKTYGVLLEAITALIHSGEPNKMNSGFLILAQLAEGCYEQIARNLANPIMSDFMVKGLNHPAGEVRGAAIKALTYFAEYLPVDVCKYHSTIVPAIISTFDDLNNKVAEKAIIAIDIFCDNLEPEDLELYMQSITEKLCMIAMKDNSTMLMRRVSVSALASCISTVEHKFKPFVTVVANLMHQIIGLAHNAEVIALKAEAINCLGKIAAAFISEDRSIYEQHVVPCLETIYHLLTTVDDFEMREGCFSFFYNLAHAIGSEFEVMFDKLIEFTLKQAASEEGVTYNKNGKNGEFSLDSDSEEEDEDLLEDEDHNTAVNIKTAFVLEKSAAITAVGQFAVACPMKFIPYYEKALSILETCYNYFDENVRQQVCKCYKDLCVAMVKTANNGVLPKFERGLPVKARFPEKIENVIQIDIFQKFLYYLNQEEACEVTGMAIEIIVELFKTLGPACFDKNLDDISNAIVKLLENESEDDELGGDDEEDEDDADGYVIEALTDLIPTLCKLCGDTFSLNFQKIYPSMMKYLNPKRDISENIYMVGCFSEVMKYTPNFLLFTRETLIPTLLEKVQYGDDEMNRNLAFCLGNIVEKGLNHVQEALPTILNILKNIFETSVEQATKDNAAAALCRVMMTIPDQFPLDAALDQILSIAPFQGDEAEEKTVIRTLLFLAEKYPQVITPKINKAIALFVDGLANLKLYNIKDELKGKIVLLLKNLANNSAEHKAQLEQVVFASEEKEKLIKLLQ